MHCDIYFDISNVIYFDISNGLKALWHLLWHLKCQSRCHSALSLDWLPARDAGAAECEWGRAGVTAECEWGGDTRLSREWDREDVLQFADRGNVPYVHLYTHVYIRVCVYTRVCVCVYVRIYACGVWVGQRRCSTVCWQRRCSICTSTYTYIYTCVCIYTRVCVCKYIFMRAECEWDRGDDPYVHLYVHIYIRVCAYIRVCVCVCTYLVLMRAECEWDREDEMLHKLLIVVTRLCSVQSYGGIHTSMWYTYIVMQSCVKHTPCLMVFTHSCVPNCS